MHHPESAGCSHQRRGDAGRAHFPNGVLDPGHPSVPAPDGFVQKVLALTGVGPGKADAGQTGPDTVDVGPVDPGMVGADRADPGMAAGTRARRDVEHRPGGAVPVVAVGVDQTASRVGTAGVAPDPAGGALDRECVEVRPEDGIPDQVWALFPVADAGHGQIRAEADHPAVAVRALAGVRHKAALKAEPGFRPETDGTVQKDAGRGRPDAVPEERCADSYHRSAGEARPVLGQSRESAGPAGAEAVVAFWRRGLGYCSLVPAPEPVPGGQEPPAPERQEPVLKPVSEPDRAGIYAPRSRPRGLLPCSCDS